jgi:hypothetical protein
MLNINRERRFSAAGTDTKSSPAMVKGDQIPTAGHDRCGVIGDTHTHQMYAV